MTGHTKSCFTRYGVPASALLTERGADTTAVKNYVAHASEEMTKHYTHLSEEYARDARFSMDYVVSRS